MVKLKNKIKINLGRKISFILIKEQDNDIKASSITPLTNHKVLPLELHLVPIWLGEQNILVPINIVIPF
jgi:hypothetical protein